MPHKHSTKLSHKERVNTIIDYIDSHIENPSHRLNLDTLASVACLSHHHISRIFKSHTGEGIHQYVKRLRLESAAKQLLYSKKTIQYIAESSSYNNFPAFTKAFKQHFGCPPSDFRAKKNTLNSLSRYSNYTEKATKDKNIIGNKDPRGKPSRLGSTFATRKRGILRTMPAESFHKASYISTL